MIIDREAATRAVQTTYPNATINRPENPSDWMRTQLALIRGMGGRATPQAWGVKR